MSLFGANMTAFAILGASGEAYHEGIGVFALMASSSGLIIPTVFYFVGTRIWSLGKRHGYLSQIQYFRQRWNSDGVGLLLFFVISALMIPYILVGLMGSGITLSQITNASCQAGDRRCWRHVADVTTCMRTVITPSRLDLHLRLRRSSSFQIKRRRRRHEMTQNIRVVDPRRQNNAVAASQLHAFRSPSACVAHVFVTAHRRAPPRYTLVFYPLHRHRDSSVLLGVLGA
jgi:hypothetical protein